jgi:hypothetical protein
MNPFGLQFDHPEFPTRVTLTLETWMSFIWIGAFYGLLAVAWAGLFASPHTLTVLLDLSTFVLNAASTWKAASPAIAQDYRLHYRQEPSRAQLFLLELLRLVGFLSTKTYLANYATKFSAPLLYLAPRPPLLLGFVYKFLLLWVLSKMLPEVTVISSSFFGLPQLVARVAAIYLDATQQAQRRRMAGAVIQPQSPNDTAERSNNNTRQS